MSRRVRHKIGIALAGGGPLGAIYEIGALVALQDAMKDIDFVGCDVYVGVSSGGAIAAGLANGITPRDIHAMFIENETSAEAFDPEILLRPAEAWESVKVGNCGSPIETEAGWLVITHGVGPMRKYCIGAVLLDLEDPTKVIGRLREPLLAPEGQEREGYVPNVVYSCGSLLHGQDLILPYAMSDKATSIASMPVARILEAMRA